MSKLTIFKMNMISKLRIIFSLLQKMTGDKSQLEKINSILKIVPNLPNQIQFNRLYYITNIYLNIDPKKICRNLLV
ncbi:hypothetical protein [Mesomycoplasma hyopneumoniae]